MNELIQTGLPGSPPMAEMSPLAETVVNRAEEPLVESSGGPGASPTARRSSGSNPRSDADPNDVMAFQEALAALSTPASDTPEIDVAAKINGGVSHHFYNVTETRPETNPLTAEAATSHLPKAEPEQAAAAPLAPSEVEPAPAAPARPTDPAAVQATATAGAATSHLPKAEPEQAAAAPLAPSEVEPAPAAPARPVDPAESLDMLTIDAQSSEMLEAAPASLLDPATALSPQNLSGPSAHIDVGPITTQPAPVQGARADAYAVADVVKQVVQTLARRDLEGLSAGREIVVRLDDRLIPDTTLVLRAAPSGANGIDEVPNPQLTLSLQTESPDVADFLSNHTSELLDLVDHELSGAIRSDGLEFELASPSLEIAHKNADALRTDTEQHAGGSDDSGAQQQDSSGHDQSGEHPNRDQHSAPEESTLRRRSETESQAEADALDTRANFEQLING